jgi:uncharacterized protein
MSSTDAQRLAERERPPGAVVMWQRWEHLLFLHWAWQAAEVQRTLPPGLTVDTFNGQAWLGIVPFFMRDVRPAWLPPLPGLSDFLELNVRTYVVDARGRPGVWFYTLDCNQWLAVKVARTFFHLRYRHADMRGQVGSDGWVNYRSRRTGQSRESKFAYRRSESGRGAVIGSLEFFLVERYRLFAHNPKTNGLLSGRVWHEPYEIGAAEVPVWDDVMLQLEGFASPGRGPDHVCATAPVDVRVFPLERFSGQ